MLGLWQPQLIADDLDKNRGEFSGFDRGLSTVDRDPIVGTLSQLSIDFERPSAFAALLAKRLQELFPVHLAPLKADNDNVGQKCPNVKRKRTKMSEFFRGAA
jgi:hypothetical protein